MAQDMHTPLGRLDIAQIGLGIIAVFFSARTAYFLSRSYYGFEYGYVPRAIEISKYKEDLISYYLQMSHTADSAEKKAERDAMDHLHSEYAKHSDLNAENNNRKSYFLHRANGSLLISVVIVIATGIMFLSNSISNPEKIVEIKVSNAKEINMSKPPSSTTSGPNPNPPLSQPAKPNPPPGQVIKESVDPKVKR